MFWVMCNCVEVSSVLLSVVSIIVLIVVSVMCVCYGLESVIVVVIRNVV